MFFKQQETNFFLCFSIYFKLLFLQKVPLCMVDLAQTIEEWKDLCSVKVDDQVFFFTNFFSNFSLIFKKKIMHCRQKYRTCFFHIEKPSHVLFCLWKKITNIPWFEKLICVLSWKKFANQFLFTHHFNVENIISYLL